MDYQHITDQLFDILDTLRKYRQEKADTVQKEEIRFAKSTDLNNKLYYLLGHLPIEEQDAFIGLAVATGYIETEGAQYYAELRKSVTDTEMNPGIIIASSYDHAAERAYVGSRVQKAIEKQHESGNCPPEELAANKQCTQDSDCEACWRHAAMKMLEV